MVHLPFFDLLLANGKESLNITNSEMFFDARNTSFSRDGSIQKYDGYVIAIGLGHLISADYLSVDREKNLIEARGHVFFILEEKMLTGEKLAFDLSTSNFALEGAQVVVNDKEGINSIVNKILGVSRDEVDFVIAKKQRLLELNEQKDDVIERYQLLRQANLNLEADQMINAYSVLLRRENAIGQQINPHLAKMPQKMRASIEARRQFWDKNRKNNPLDLDKFKDIGYFKIQGSEIKRVSENNYISSEAFMTPCKCQEGDTPAWGFRSRKIKTQFEGYAELYDPIVEIAGVPILYLPFLKVPVKGKRQTGFLIPNLAFTSKLGTVFSQPLFLALEENKDATFIADVFEKRGLRLGAEFRYAQKSHSGFSLHLEGIRDQIWQTNIINRRRMVEAYESGLDQAFINLENSDYKEPDHFLTVQELLSTPSFWLNDSQLNLCLNKENLEECKQSLIRQRLSLRENPWRGQLNWSGRTALAPRIALVSKGSLQSDHRYLGDFFVPNSNVQFNQIEPRLLIPISWRMNWDAQDFFVGFGGHYSDHLLMNTSLAGVQNPLDLRLLSRLFLLTPDYMRIPVYVNFEYIYKNLLVDKYAPMHSGLNSNTVFSQLGSGDWQKAKARLISPLFAGRVFTVDHFTDLEMRIVDYEVNTNLDRLDSADRAQIEKIKKDQTTYKTYRTGLNFEMPLEGVMLLGEKKDQLSGQHTEKYLKHGMNWKMTLSLRPQVVIDGDYGKAPYSIRYNQNGESIYGAPYLTYFYSDTRKEGYGNIYDGLETMVSHQQVIFSTHHFWQIFESEWQRKIGKTKTPKRLAKESDQQYYHNLARAELDKFLDLPITSSQDMFNKFGEWHFNSYQKIETERATPVSIAGSIAYDFLKEDKRKKLENEGVKEYLLPQPWSPVHFNLNLDISGFRLNTVSAFNIYYKAFEDMNFQLSLPIFFNIATDLYYVIARHLALDEEGELNIAETRTRSIKMERSLSRNLNVAGAYSIRADRKQQQQRSASLEIKYYSASDCWGASLGWQKNFNDATWKEGSYYFAMNIKFFGHYRDFNNMLSRYNKQT